MWGTRRPLGSSFGSTPLSTITPLVVFGLGYSKGLTSLHPPWSRSPLLTSRLLGRMYASQRRWGILSRPPKRSGCSNFSKSQEALNSTEEYFFLDEVDINKKTENQAKMTKLSMEWKRLCKIKAKDQKSQSQSQSRRISSQTEAGTEEYY
ncbi:hypothetical protein Tco_0863290 [Tanacetum coccineum]